MAENIKNAKKIPLPAEVKKILQLSRRLEYKLLKKAGWCTRCYREKIADGSTCKCQPCLNKGAKRKRDKRTWPRRGEALVYCGKGRPPIGCGYIKKPYNHIPWAECGRGRPPKKKEALCART